MRIIYIIIALVGLTAGTLSAQEGVSLRNLLAHCPLLTEGQRQALPEPEHSGATLIVPTSSLSSLEFTLMSAKGQSPLVLAIERINEPTADSRISLYTTEWQPIESPFAPKAELWLTERGESYENKRLEQLLYPLYLDIQLEGAELRVTPILPLSKEDEELHTLKALIQQAIRPIAFGWDGKQFQPLTTQI